MNRLKKILDNGIVALILVLAIFAGGLWVVSLLLKVKIVIVVLMTIIPLVSVAIYYWGCDGLTLKGSLMFKNIVQPVTIVTAFIIIILYNNFKAELEKELLNGRITTEDVLIPNGGDDNDDHYETEETFHVAKSDSNKDIFINLWVVFVILGSPTISYFSSNMIVDKVSEREKINIYEVIY